MKRLPIFTSALLVIAPIMHSLISSIQPAIAQKNLPICSPPNPGEYLLLVISPTQDNQQQLRSALPTEIETSVCNYTDKTVTRIPRFNKVDDANRWARYIQNVVGLSAIITTLPPQANTQRTPQQNNPENKQQNPQATITTSRVNNYNPRVLGEGYAVLVDYSNRPELVEPLKKAVGGDVGFVSYGQRPYLLAVYTTNQKEAYNTLQRLSENGFLATLADGRQVVLLRSIIR